MGAYSNVRIPTGAVISCGATEASLVSLGVLDGDTVVTFTGNPFTKKGSRAETLIKTLKNPSATITGTMLQLDYDNIYKMKPGLMTRSVVAGTPVAGATENVASGDWSYNTHIPITGQDGDGTVQTINSVTAGTDGVLTVNVDYITHYNANTNNWGIIILDSTTVTTTAQTIVIDYDYTPAAEVQYSIGDAAVEITGQVWQAVYDDTDNDQYIKYTLYSGSQTDDMVFTLSPAETDDVNKYPFTITGELDTTRTAGDQLMKIEVIDY